MPRKCIIDECKKNVKWRVLGPDVIHLCNDHAYLYAEDVTKIVNNPCQTCVTETPRRVREATFGPIVNGKRTRIYCKLHFIRITDLLKEKSFDIRNVSFRPVRSRHLSTTGSIKNVFTVSHTDPLQSYRIINN